MAAYTLHLDPGAHPGDADALDRAFVVKDGFSWGAFFFTALWFFAHRLWLAGLAVIVAALALVAGAWLAGAGYGIIWLAMLLFSLLVGLEASSLRRWTLARRGRPAVRVVSAGSAEEAEAKAFERWLGQGLGQGVGQGLGQELGQGASEPDVTAGPRPSARNAPWPSAGPASPVIGLFPEVEPRR